MAPFDARPALAETCRIVAGRVPLWPLHRARLEAGGCDEALLVQVETAVARAAAEYPHARPGQRYRLALTVAPDSREVRASVSRRLSSLDVPGGVVVARIDVAALPDLPPGPAKPADRSYYDDALGRAKALGAHAAVLVAPDGTVIDGSSATVWIAEKDALVTPPSPSAVPGVGRALVLAHADAAGLRVRVEPLTWERFSAGDEAFLTNAFGGVAPVRGRGGAHFERVAEIFAKAWTASE